MSSNPGSFRSHLDYSQLLLSNPLELLSIGRREFELDPAVIANAFERLAHEHPSISTNLPDMTVVVVANRCECFPLANALFVKTACSLGESAFEL